MPITHRNLALLVLIPFGFAACDTIPKGTITKMMNDQGFIAYIPAQGDPRYESSWNNYGPGAIIRKEGYNVQYDARNILGQTRLIQISADANNPQTRIPYAAFSGNRTSGSELDTEAGWAFSPGVATIKASLQLQNATSVDVRFGNTWVAQITEQDVRQAPGRADVDGGVRQLLRNGKSRFVVKTIYTDSLTVYFKTQRNGGGEVDLKIPTADAAKLGGKYQVTSDGGVTVSGPIMVGYIALPRDAAQELFPPRR